MAFYNHFIPENVAPKDARDIGVYRDGKKIGRIPLNSLAPPVGKPLYSFGLISDPHVNESDVANDNFAKALKHFGKDTTIEFVVVAGDLIVWVKNDTGERLKAFKKYEEIVHNNSSGKKIVAIGGNHEQWWHENIPQYMEDHAGVKNCVYHFKKGNDLFVMAGSYGYYGADGVSYQIMSVDDLKSIRALMNENKGIRCFFIHHVLPFAELPEYNIDDATQYGYLPLSFYAHFKNMTMFHGHSHLPFVKQETNTKANYREDMGFRSVHIPGLCDYAEGYVIDVYEDGYHLRGMNFSTGKPVPIATYWIDTTITNVDDEY